jgi:kynureninase
VDAEAYLEPAGAELVGELEAACVVPSQRHRFAVPAWDGGEVAYFAGNSLGLMPSTVPAAVEDVLTSWSTRAVDGHLDGDYPWLPYHETMRETAARLVGAVPGEAVVMNSLTVNLHLLMVSFYRPTAERHRIVIEGGAFPSDDYAVASQAAFHGYDPADAVVRLQPRRGEHCLRTEDVLRFLDEEGASVALVLLSGVNFRTGQLFDLEAVTAAGHVAGCVVGWDLAHAAGNVPLRLHDWGVDFAAWCSYKYLNSGPGSAAGCFVHERHGGDESLPRLAGWWGNDPASRFEMHPDFRPRAGADGWQVSNPPILALAPVRASLDVFDAVGMEALRERSLALTGFLEQLVDVVARRRRVALITPRDVAQRGAQLSLEVDDAAAVEHALRAGYGVVVDTRPPNIVRLAPAPLYNTFDDCRRAALAFDAVLPAR